METKDYVLSQVAWSRRTSDGVTADLTDEQLNWTPPGTANPVGATLLHAIASEDMFIHVVLQGKPMIFASGGWTERLGVPAQGGRGPNWDDAKAKKLAVSDLLAYQQAVRADMDAYLAGLTAEDLDRNVTTRLGDRPAAEVFTLMVVHAAHHIGEIAALKGVQGAKGLPF